MSTPLYTPQDRAEYERRKADWGESGPSFAIAQDRVITVANRLIVIENARGYVPKDSAQQQKQRTFIED